MMSPKGDSPKPHRRRRPQKKVGRASHVEVSQERPLAEMRPKDEAVMGPVSLRLSRALEKRIGRGVEWIASPHFGERSGIIDTVVLHYTATGSLEETIRIFRKEAIGPSSHYVVGKDGLIIQMVDIEKKAWHAGESEFQGRGDVNDFSIGIELVNWGLLKERDGLFFAWPGEYGTAYQGKLPVFADGQWWDPFTETQYDVLTELIRQIRVCYPSITPERIVGHEGIARPKGRKMDPGLAFDWNRVWKA